MGTENEQIEVDWTNPAEVLGYVKGLKIARNIIWLTQKLPFKDGAPDYLKCFDNALAKIKAEHGGRVIGL